MSHRNIIALCGATLAIVLAPAAALAAGPADVIVRVEGLTHALLTPTVAHTHTGSITKGGTPSGRCPATTAAGALGVATRGNWNGTWEPTYSTLLLTSVLGETHTLKSKDYWSIWVDGRYASTGLCGLKLHRGEQLLFAAVADTFSGYPLALSAPANASPGRSFTVKVTFVNSKGLVKPLAHARVHGGGLSATTDSRGIAQLVDGHAGKLTLTADETGYIRAAPASVRVSG